jgi:hypothetical protein
VARLDVDKLRKAMRAAEAALAGGAGTRAAWTKASVDYYTALHPAEAKWQRTGADDEIPSVEQILDRSVVCAVAGKGVPRAIASSDLRAELELRAMAADPQVQFNAHQDRCVDRLSSP